MTITMNLNDLLMFIFIIIAVVLAIYIILSIKKFNRTLDNIDDFICTNRNNIEKCINNLPNICDNINSVTKSIKEKAVLLDKYIPGKNETESYIDIESMLYNLASVFDLLSSIKELFSNRKKSRFKRSFKSR